MKIACLQFAPVLGDVDNNLTRADAVLAKANVQDLDLLVLPELAFSGKLYFHFTAILSTSTTIWVCKMKNSPTHSNYESYRQSQKKFYRSHCYQFPNILVQFVRVTSLPVPILPNFQSLGYHQKSAPRVDLRSVRSLEKVSACHA